MNSWKVSPSWNSYLTTLKNAAKDVYFTEEYVNLYQTDKDIAECFIYQNGNDFFIFPYLKREHNLFGEHFYDFETQYGYGGPLSNTNNTSFLIEAQTAFSASCKANNIVAGFVRFHPLLLNENCFTAVGNVIDDRQTIAMDLSLSETEIWDYEIHPKHRNVIRKAENNGLKFEVDDSFNYLNDFKRLYDQTMNRKDADNYYFFDYGYYTNLKKSLNGSFLGLVRYGERIISAAIFIHSDVYGHYHLSGSDPKFIHLYPNNFMIYKVALHMKGLGIVKFHLGGGSDSNPNNSLFKFKERFSKNRYWFKIGKAVFNTHLYDKICSCWEKNNSDKRQIFKNIHLKYRY